MKLLLIEDDEADERIFRRYLSKCEVVPELTFTSTLKEAREIFQKEDFDLIFCDYNLPDGSAIDLLNEVKTEDASIVVITSHGDVARATASLKAGAFDFIEKDLIDSLSLDRIFRNVERQREEVNRRKELEKELERNFLNTKAILDTTQDGIWSLSMEGELLVINKRAVEALSFYQSNKIEIGENLFDNLIEMFRIPWLIHFQTSVEKGYHTSIDKFEHQQGDFYLETSSALIKNNGVPQGVIYVSRNVTEREQSEEKLRASEKKFRSVFEGSELPIMVESLKDNKILVVNKACAELHKYKVEEMVGMSIFDTIPPKHLEKSQVNYHEFLNNDAQRLESFIFTSDRNVVPVSIAINEIEYNNEPCNLLFFQDVTIIKEQEAKLEEARALAIRTAHYKSQFLANMSHEIRTPMNAMIGFTELLNNTRLDPEQKEYVEVIHKSGKDLLVIIDDILDFSKIQAGKMELRTEAVNLNRTVRKIVQLHKYKADDKGIELILNQTKDFPQGIIADETRISQILNNIVSNAIKFTSKGKVEIVTDFKVIKDDELETYFEIKDSGIGIPHKNLQSIFEDFSQVDSSLQRTQNGTGLGLSIVKSLVDLMGGKVTIDSEMGKGTTFKVKIPLQYGLVDAAALSLGASNNPKEQVDLSGLKLLVIEDNEVNQLLAKRVLSKMGVTAQFAANGKEGVELFRSYQPHLIFMDIQMPIMNGYEATTLIREESDVVIYGMTAHVLEEERQKCMQVGMNGFIPKPFKAKEIKDILEEHLALAHQEKSADNQNTDPIALLGFPNLTELADGDLDFALNLLEIFVKNASTELEEMKLAQAQSNFEKIKILAHKIRSSLNVLDFKNLAQMTIELEQGPNNSDLVEKYLLELNEKLTLVKSKLNHHTKD